MRRCPTQIEVIWDLLARVRPVVDTDTVAVGVEGPPALRLAFRLLPQLIRVGQRVDNVLLHLASKDDRSMFKRNRPTASGDAETPVVAVTAISER